MQGMSFMTLIPLHLDFFQSSFPTFIVLSKDIGQKYKYISYTNSTCVVHDTASQQLINSMDMSSLTMLGGK